MGLFEGGDKANGVQVNAVSTWTSPKEIVAAISKATGQEVIFNPISAELYGSFLPENIRAELVETLLLVGNYNYYGQGAEKKQQESDKWLLPGVDRISYEQWAAESGPWTF